METTQDAVAILHAIEELTKRQTLPAENEKIRASRDKWREVAEQLIDGLRQNDDKALAGAVKAYTKLIKVPANAPAQ
jgi:hypothetical protein